MKLSKKLITKFQLSKEDQDDINSEIALSELEYGYQRFTEYIVIDYLSKTRGYKRIGQSGKRQCVFKTEEYSEAFNQSPGDDRALRISGDIALRNYSETDRESQLDCSDNLNYLNEILNNASNRTKEIMMDFYNGETLLEIGKKHGVTQSRVSQICDRNHSKINLFFSLNLNPEIAKVVRW